MATLTDEQIATLNITNFIFHVVHHGRADPDYFEEVPLGRFEPFFIARIKDTLRGNRFSFMPGSPVKLAIEAWQAGTTSFVDFSKRLADQFNALYDRRVTPGVLIVIELVSGSSKYYSLIKYDSDEVVSYTRSGGQAVLEEVVNNFTQSAKALQKSALVDLQADPADGQVAVIDRQSRASISELFRKFLGVTRTKRPAELTEALQKAVIKVVAKHRDLLPASFTYRVGELVRDIAEHQKTFDAQTFYGQLFGTSGNDRIKASFERELAAQGLSGEVFDYVPDALPPERRVRYKTHEGVLITVPAGLGDHFHVSEDGKVITITTAQLSEI